MPDQARFLDFMDMIDGGGTGRMGDKFEGGGIFSALANLVATPYGSEDPARRARREAAYRAAGLLAPEEAEAAPAAAPAVTRGGTDISNLRPQLRPDNFMTEAQKEQVVMNQPVGSGYPDMSMPAIAGYTTPAPTSIPSADPYAPVGSSNPAVQAEIARRQEAQRMMQYEPMGSGGATAATLPTIYPSQAAQVDAVNQANREAMRQAMGEVPRTQYDIMTREQRAQQGLPVGGLDLAYAGPDAFKQYSGRGMSTGDPEFDAFMARARNDAQFASIIDSPQTMRNIFNMYKQQRAAQAGM